MTAPVRYTLRGTPTGTVCHPQVPTGTVIDVMPVEEHLEYVRRAGEIQNRETDALLDRAERLERQIARLQAELAQAHQQRPAA